MEPNKKRRREGNTEMKDSVLVRWTATMLPHDSPESQARANRPLSERGPNLALYHELQKANAELPPLDELKPDADQAPTK